MNDEDKAALDEKILTYAKSSLKDWKVNPSDSELA